MNCLMIMIATLLIALMAIVPTSQAKGPPEDKAPAIKIGSDTKELAEKQAEQSKEMQELKKKKEEERLKGLEKQKEKKAEQVQNELDKGSEKGQAMRTEHRKKWWKFGFGKEDEVPVPVTK